MSITQNGGLIRPNPEPQQAVIPDNPQVQNNDELLRQAGVGSMDELLGQRGATNQVIPEPTVQASPEEEGQFDVYATLESIGGPNQAQVEEWKQLHGDVQLLALDNAHMYIFRALKRSEYIQLQNQWAGNDRIDENMQQESVVSRCLLWPRIPVGGFTTKPAGLVGSLYSDIMMSSLFLSEQMIMGLTIRL